MKTSKTSLFFCLLFLFSSLLTAQPLTGVKIIDNSGSGHYLTFAEAINALNTNSVGSGGVTFSVTDGQVFNSGPLIITATGTATDQIVFKQSGTGDKPKINFTGVSGAEACFRLVSSDYITFDGLEIADAGTSMEYGFQLVGAASDGCRYNTVKNCIVDLDKAGSNHYGVYVQSSANSDAGRNINNKFFNNNIRDCRIGYYFINSSSLYPDIGNEINSIDGGASIVENISETGIRIDVQKDLIISKTIFQNFSGSSFYAIHSSTGKNTISLIDNTIRDLTATSSIYGIYINNADTVTISGNLITRLSSTEYVYPIRINTGSLVNIYNNNINNVEYTGSSTRAAYGLYVSGGTDVNIYNNMISDIKAPASTNTKAGACGIFLSGGSNVNMFFNSVLLDYTSSGAGNISAALYTEANSPAKVLFSNNIFVNRVDATGGLRAVAFGKGSSGGNSYILNLSEDSDNNLYYAGTPGDKNFIFYDDVQMCQTLEQYQSFVASKNIDEKAITENVPFVSGDDLHISNSALTLIESAGISITAPITIADDYDGDVRNQTTPDIGADEGDFLSNDVNPPIISYTPFTSTPGTLNRTVSDIIITDYNGINVNPGTKPRVYYKRKTDSNELHDNTSTTQGWKWVEAGNSSSPFEFTLDYSLLSGSAVSSGDIIQYFIIAQDNNSTPNVGVNYCEFNVPPGSVELLSTAFPVTGNINSYSISFSGSYEVGTGHKYTSLTRAGGLFEAISSGSFSGHVSVKITSDLDEDGTNSLTQWQETGVGDYVLDIMPANDGMKIISGSSGTGLIKITGCSRVVFNGQFSNEAYNLTFRNADLTAPVFYFSEGSQANILHFIIIESSSNNIDNAAIKFGSGNNSRNTILNCMLRDLPDAVSTPGQGILIAGAGNNEIEIKDNTFRNFGTAAIVTNGGCSNVLIEGNEIYMTRQSSIGSVYGIHLRNSNQTKIFRNKIYALDGSSGVHGIYYEGSSGVISSQIINNMITLIPVAARTLSGITYSGYGTNTLTVYHNSVYLGGTLTSGPYDSYAFGKTDACNVLNVKNNIFVNDRTNSGGTGSHYAVYFNNIDGADNFDYNDYYSAVQNGFYGNWLGSTITNLALWRTSSLNTMDASSFAQDPVFISGSDLHLNTNVIPYFLSGTALGIANDFDGDTRDPNNPYIGCDEDPMKVLPVEATEMQITEFSLEQNYPNPFNPVTKISWQSPVSSHQTLKVYDVLGNEVATLVDEYREAGRYEVEFQSTVGSRQLTSRPGSALTSGIYLYRLEAGSYTETRKMILLK